MTTVEFWVAGKPIGYNRDAARFSYLSADARAWRFDVAAAYHKAAGFVPPHIGPVSLAVQAYGCTLDGDNALKEIADALNGVAYRDDNQVTSWAVSFPEREVTPKGKARRTGETREGALITLTLHPPQTPTKRARSPRARRTR